MHNCTRFQKIWREGSWRQSGLFREREIETVFVCKDCGRERSRRFRKLVAIEKEASTSTVVADPVLRRLARNLASASRNRTDTRAEGLIRRLGGVQSELDIERLAAAGPFRLIYRRFSGGLRLHTIRVLEHGALDEIARPGVQARRVRVLAEARNNVRSLVNPEAISIREILGTEGAACLDERVIKALAALAQLLESGDATPAKAFSAQVLGNSKSLSAIRQRLEGLVGPSHRLGIRDWGGLVIMGGAGLLHLGNVDIRLGSLRCVGISSDDILGLHELCVPPGGVLVIENLTPFQACLEHFGCNDSVLFLWSGGFPNRGVKKLLEEAAHRKVPMRVWCDLDLRGIRIARLIHEITGGIATLAAKGRDQAAQVVQSPARGSKLRSSSVNAESAASFLASSSASSVRARSSARRSRSQLSRVRVSWEEGEAIWTSEPRWTSASSWSVAIFSSRAGIFAPASTARRIFGQEV